jgi:hypothetical protein
MSRWIVASLVALPLAGCARPAPPPSTPKAASAPPGVAVGSAAPGFRLKDQAGAERSLDELRKAGPVAIVFYRSARW